ncbi:MAG: hypothetical protein GJU77_01655 [Ferrovum sp.]|jgi:hypothetical protein|nr:hypothetical protein [Ferrovum sp.]NDU89291.1 hypothetical protein [Ferrovum sp.]
MSTRFHIRITRNGTTTRTTVSMDKTLSGLLAASLGENGLMADHGTVRAWLDKTLSEWAAFDPLLPVTRQVTHLALLHIARPEYVDALTALDAPSGVMRGVGR